ncbi:MAG: hypothetical protein JWN12_39 [Candidatus Saccharibacteria bacterium]|nr:hypothetical protein [Candidatus Saccharibacteria bacterium]
MKLVETNSFARDLEQGLGDAHWLFKAIDPQLRLRTSVCGVTSTAITEHLLRQGYDAETVISTPNLSVDPTMKHVVSIVHSEGEDIVIDGTYSQFLAYAGLHFGYVMMGGKDFYPKEKIESFDMNESEGVVTKLSLLSRYVLDHYEPLPDHLDSRMEFAFLTDEEIKAELSEIWNPDNFDTFEPSPDTLQAALTIARRIVPEHVKLVA